MTEKLRFVAKGTACVPDPHGAESTPMRRGIVGRAHKEVEPGKWAWVRNDQPAELPYHHDLRKAVMDGDLWPADEATAKACGVAFDPKFGGEWSPPAPAKEEKKSSGNTGGKADS